MGTYLHGLFTSDAFREKLLTSHGIASSETNFVQLVDDALNELANELDSLIDFDQLLKIASRH